MQSPPVPRYLIPPRSKYSPKHHVLKRPQLPFLPQCQRPSFTPIQNYRQNYSWGQNKIPIVTKYYSVFFLVIKYLFYCENCGPGSSVGIATDYGPDGPGSNPGGDEFFRPSRPALVPTQPPVQWVPGLSRGVKSGRGVLLTTHPPSSAAFIEE